MVTRGFFFTIFKKYKYDRIYSTTITIITTLIVNIYRITISGIVYLSPTKNVAAIL